MKVTDRGSSAETSALSSRRAPDEVLIRALAAVGHKGTGIYPAAPQSPQPALGVNGLGFSNRDLDEKRQLAILNIRRQAPRSVGFDPLRSHEAAGGLQGKVRRSMCCPPRIGCSSCPAFTARTRHAGAPL
jgi:hypothetical protein